MKFDTLWKGDYISIISPEEHPYEVVLEKNGVAILPIVNNKLGIRKELCPPYLIQDKSGEKFYYTLITGGIEDGDDLTETVFKELKEEAGIDVSSYDILFKKLDLPYSKSSAARTNVYILDIPNASYTKPVGDGGEYEDVAKTIWVTPTKLENIINQNDNIDYLLVSMFYILKDITRTRFFWSD